MKHFYQKVLLAVLVASFFACSNNDNDPQPQVNYDKMIGTWTLNSYTEHWVNTTENIEERNSSIDKGVLTIKKEKDEEGAMQYFYTENFLTQDGEYEGMMLIENGFLNLCAKDGFIRKDLENLYEYKVSFPSNNKMEWSYEWTGAHIRNGVTHQDKRTVKAIFTKQ